MNSEDSHYARNGHISRARRSTSPTSAPGSRAASATKRGPGKAVANQAEL